MATNLVQYMKTDGSWRKSGYHINNLTKNYTLHRESTFWNYYVGRGMIYRVFNISNVLELVEHVTTRLYEAKHNECDYTCTDVAIKKMRQRLLKYQKLLLDGVIE